jgi:hypothetical protein
VNRPLPLIDALAPKVGGRVHAIRAIVVIAHWLDEAARASTARRGIRPFINGVALGAAAKLLRAQLVRARIECCRGGVARDLAHADRAGLSRAAGMAGRSPTDPVP